MIWCNFSGLILHTPIRFIDLSKVFFSLEWDRWYRAVFTWLSKVIGFGFGFTTPFGWLVYLLWFWFYDSQVKTTYNFISNVDNNFQTFYVTYMIYLKREL